LIKQVFFNIFDQQLKKMAIQRLSVRNVLFALFGLVLLCSTTAFAGRWALDWNDEFDGTTLDTSKWDAEVNCWGGGNGEK
jgi:hypothetical protein